MGKETPSMTLQKTSSFGQNEGDESRVHPDKGFFQTRLVQVYALQYKAIKLMIRAWPVTLIRFLVPPVLLFFFWLFLFTAPSGEIQHPTPSPALGPVPKCIVGPGKSNCTTLLWGPSNSQDAANIVAIFSAQNKFSQNDNTIVPAVGMNEQNITDYIQNNQNSTQLAVYFYTDNNGSLLKPAINYRIWYNNTNVTTFLGTVETYEPVNYLFQAQNSLNNAILSFLSNGTPQNPTGPSLSVSFKDYPTLPNDFGYLYMTMLLIVFVFIALSFPFLFLLYSVVHERGSGLRGFMTLMGLKDMSWWISAMIEHGFFYVVPFILMEGLGYAVPLDFFRNASFGVHLLLFFSYAFSMLGWVMVLSTFLQSAKAAVILGFALFFAGLIASTVVASINYIIFELWQESTAHKYGPWGPILSLFPPFSLCCGLLLIQVTTMGPLYNQAVKGSHFGYSNIYKNPNTIEYALQMPYAPNMNYFMCFMFVEGVVLVLFAMYLDNVLPDEYRVSKKFYYPFSPYYWGILKSKHSEVITDLEDSPTSPLLKGKEKEHQENPEFDQDVAHQKQKVLEDHGESALLIAGLEKEYGGSLLAKFGIRLTAESGKLVKAVDGLWLTADPGSLLCILGQNGAGKTTTIKILTGMVAASKGVASIFGRSVAYEMDDIRSFLGVCPQFDILWGDLTAYETLYVLDAIKTADFPRKEAIESSLNDVRLLNVKDRCAGTYSGGMKRRLSVAISTIGNPKVIFMDEPTTGMDPANRRYIWDLILRMKKGRLIIITTHSMEEADVLGEKIAIMKHGCLRAVGNPLHLKSKFGDGYRLSLVADEDKIDEIKDYLTEHLPATLQNQNAGSLVYSLPPSSLTKLEEIFDWMTNTTYTNQFGIERRLVMDFGLSNSTLEDVFMKVGVDEDSEENAKK